MNRLNGVKVNNKEWGVIELENTGDNIYKRIEWWNIEPDNTKYHTYELIDKEKQTDYIINDIIGIEQINRDEFLVYDRYDANQYRIVRYKTEDSKLKKVFEKKFSEFYFVTDDRILFGYYDKSSKYRSSGIYSIKDNDYIEDGKWLDYKAIRPISNMDNPQEIELHVEITLVSEKLDHPRLLFIVNSDTLQPNSPCYSELRGDYIEVSSKEDIENLEKEEKDYIRTIEEMLYELENETLPKGQKSVLVKTRQDYKNGKN